MNYLSTAVYKSVSRFTTYEDAVAALEALYVPTKSEIYARHVLTTYRQENGQTIDQYVQKLRELVGDCNYTAATAEVRQDEAIRDSFITGLLSSHIRERLLEHQTLSLVQALNMARALETAQRHSLSYLPESVQTPCAVAPTLQSVSESSDIEQSKDQSTLAVTNSKCFFCGQNRHPRTICPARDAVCKLCGKQGHFQRVCRSGKSRQSRNVISGSLLSSLTIAAAPKCLQKATSDIIVNGINLQALIDTGSSESYVSAKVVGTYRWKIFKSKSKISMANTKHTSDTQGHCLVHILFKDSHYHNFKLSILPNLCADILLGHDFLNLHQKLEIPFDGHKPSISLCSLTAANVPLPALFGNLSSNCKPITTKSRRHSHSDELFIRQKVQKLLHDGIIEPSTSP